jgi:hypothetical protein
MQSDLRLFRNSPNGLPSKTNSSLLPYVLILCGKFATGNHVLDICVDSNVIKLDIITWTQQKFLQVGQFELTTATNPFN